MNHALIQYLKKHSDFVPVPDLEKALKARRDALFTDVEDLIEEGYSVEFHPYLGVKLLDIPDRLLPHEINEDLNTKHVGRNLLIRDEVASTNEEAFALLEADPDLPDGTTIVAEAQSAGRGRMGRAWHSPRGAGLWLSVVLKCPVAPDKLPVLTAMASLAVANMLQQFIQLPSEIKWPNDIMLRGRKCCGVLVEARSNLPDTWVLGIGLNVNQQAADFPPELKGLATSLRMERPGQQALNRVRVLRPLLFYLDKVYDLVLRKKYDKIAKAWAEFVHMGGKRISLQQGGLEHTGTVARVDPLEGIALRLDSGETRQFPAEAVNNVRSA
ncbi:MAG: biotin--[acetyl-CoA-carboxylase] ligase [Planctomycetes bacterium]|nr:biotin--[acetyl-CoA-carboxylase] ligase [Planctomycetota bacterium]